MCLRRRQSVDRLRDLAEVPLVAEERLGEHGGTLHGFVETTRGLLEQTRAVVGAR